MRPKASNNTMIRLVVVATIWAVLVRKNVDFAELATKMLEMNTGMNVHNTLDLRIS